MKHVLGICLIGILSVGFSASKFTPPGTKKVAGIDFYLDQKEVTNFAWAELLIDLHHRHGEESQVFKDLLPDKVLWKKTYGQSFKLFNITSSVVVDHPIVGITHEQAMKYCAWRSRRVSEKFGRKVTYELLSASDFEKLNGRFKKRKRAQNEPPKAVSKATKIKGFFGLFSNVDEFVQETDLIIDNNQTRPISDADQLVGFRCKATVQ